MSSTNIFVHMENRSRMVPEPEKPSNDDSTTNFPKQGFALRGSGALKAGEGSPAARGLDVHERCQYFICFTRFFEKSIAVAAVAWGVAPPRCSHSNIIFEKPIKTYEILILLARNHVLLIKPMENQHFGSQNALAGCLNGWLARWLVVSLFGVSRWGHSIDLVNMHRRH